MCVWTLRELQPNLCHHLKQSYLNTISEQQCTRLTQSKSCHGDLDLAKAIPPQGESRKTRSIHHFLSVVTCI